LCYTAKHGSVLIRKLSHRRMTTKFDEVVIWLNNVCCKEVKMS